jgi:catechol 2,3-dioxygenase-like lactoylglutathione lyase family enzyme
MGRGIDHLVIAVRDLDAAGRFYETLGFRVGGRNRHPWGTENRIVQLAGSFLELITAGEGAPIPPHANRQFSFGAFVRDYLSRREGLAMLVLDSSDARADALAFAGAGIGDFEPFSFERRGTRPDGSETQVAFTLAFAQDEAAPQAGFFVCQHHYPDNFWNPEFQSHPNRASILSAVVLATPEPKGHVSFLRAFTGTDATEQGDHDATFLLERGRIDVMTADDAAEIYGSVDVEPQEPALAAFAVRIPDPDRQALRLEAAGVPFQRIGSRLVVPASAASGVAIAFEPG